MNARQQNGMWLFKSLIKDGCEWHGDVLSKKWSECLIVPDASVMVKAKRTLMAYVEGNEYSIRDNAIWIA
jgi:hypothetical protein